MDVSDRQELSAGRSRRRSDSDDTIEVRRYLDALKRARWPLALFVILATGIAVGVSTALPKQYKASASIVKQVASGPYDSVNVDSLTRELQTIQRLLLTSSVLDQAAPQLKGETTGSLSQHVSSSVDPDANILYVTATGDTPQITAARANAVANAFVNEQRDTSRRQYSRARAGLLSELDRVRDDPAASDQEAAIRQRLSELSVAQANAGADLQVAQRATPPSTPTSPRPVRNGVIAFFLAMFVGVLVVLGRDQLVPRVSGPRELSRLLDLPMLTAIPYVRRRLGRRKRLLTGIEYEAYQTLGASVRFSLPPEEQTSQVLLVTSALHAEGKSTVTARLGRALAQSGHPTLLVSADLRWPTLHEIVDIPVSPGLTELIQEAGEHGGDDIDRLIDASVFRLEGGPRGGELDAIASGAKPNQPAQLLAGRGAQTVFDRLRVRGYSYVLIDAPPVLGIADSQSLATYADSLLWVSRLDRVTLENVMDARDILDRLDARPIGLVVIGARSEASPYYVGVRAPSLDEA